MRKWIGHRYLKNGKFFSSSSSSRMWGIFSALLLNKLHSEAKLIISPRSAIDPGRSLTSAATFDLYTQRVICCDKILHIVRKQTRKIKITKIFNQTYNLTGLSVGTNSLGSPFLIKSLKGFSYFYCVPECDSAPKTQMTFRCLLGCGSYMQHTCCSTASNQPNVFRLNEYHFFIAMQTNRK